jgi:hypothetical protein
MLSGHTPARRGLDRVAGRAPAAARAIPNVHTTRPSEGFRSVVSARTIRAEGLLVHHASADGIR